MLPYLTSDFDGIGGVIRERAEDFFVQEIPAYEPSGEGEHCYIEIQKVNLTTFQAIRRVAEAVGVNPRDIGFAGLKDRHAITRQILSIPGVSEEKMMTTPIEGLSVLWAARHGNKLRPGHLRGNRFAVKIRGVDPASVVRITAPLKTLVRRGLPNYFGQQRFGNRNDNDQLGAALIAGDNRRLLHLLLGNPKPEIDPPEIIQARTLFDRGNFEQSMRHWPRTMGLERRLLARFASSRRPGATVRMIEPRLRQLWISALQARVFNDLLASRIDSIDRILPGEMCMKLENGACFHATDPQTEQPRCDAWEISPTGPMIGYRVSPPSDQALRLELEAFERAGLKPEDFNRVRRDRARGERRSLRARVRETRVEGGVDEHGAYVLVAFTLPAGAFATTLLRELMKPDRHPTGDGGLEQSDDLPDPGDDEGLSVGDLAGDNASPVPDVPT